MSDQETLRDEMMSILTRQRKSYIAEGEVSAEARIDRIDRAVSILEKSSANRSGIIARFP